jgi:hypothetical protein
MINMNFHTGNSDNRRFGAKSDSGKQGVIFDEPGLIIYQSNILPGILSRARTG